MTSTALTIRDLATSDDYEQCIALQRETWGDDFRELVPPAMLQIVQKMGGLAAGAFDPQGRLVGFVFGLTGVRDGRVAHWSHMLAVREPHRDRGLGQRLKAYQRERLLVTGVDRMYWTYDPLVARNANLNLNKLGARVIEYVPDMYGANPMSETDSVIGTDRFIVEWPLVAAPRPRRGSECTDAPLVSVVRGAVPRGALPDAGVVRIEIPDDVQGLKQQDPDAAVAWRTMTRRAFLHYLGRGYRIEGFVRDVERHRCCYIVRRHGAP